MREESSTQVLIAIEGVDGGGKSTLVETIRTLEPTANVIHLGPPERSDTAIDECIQPLGSYHAGSEDVVVFDRAHWGCPIYGSLYRPDRDIGGYGDMGPYGWRYVELFFESRGCVTVLVDCDPEVAKARCLERGEDYINLDHLPGLADKYTLLFAESLTGMFNRRLVVPADTADLAHEVIEAAKAKARNFHALSPYKSYVGPRYPNLLVVAGPNRDERIKTLTELDKLIDWQSVGFVSSLPEPQLEDLTELLGRPEVSI